MCRSFAQVASSLLSKNSLMRSKSFVILSHNKPFSAPLTLTTAQLPLMSPLLEVPLRRIYIQVCKTMNSVSEARAGTEPQNNQSTNTNNNDVCTVWPYAVEFQYNSCICCVLDLLEVCKLPGTAHTRSIIQQHHNTPTQIASVEFLIFKFSSLSSSFGSNVLAYI